MADGTRSRVDCERRSGRRRRKTVLDNQSKKEQNETIARSAEAAAAAGGEVEPLVPDCAVCLQPCVYPSRLPCSHIFCFLCLKGIVSQGMRCAMCRQPIPPDYLEHPDLLALPADPLTAKHQDAPEDQYQWFYEGRDGWWQYDERTSGELESAYKQGERSCELLVAGFLYVADFTTMLQVRRNQSFRVRKIKRDLATMPKKGIAGLRLPHSAIPTTTANADADALADQLFSSLTIASSAVVDDAASTACDPPSAAN